MNRRDVLRTLAGVGTAATAALAGCSSLHGDGDDARTADGDAYDDDEPAGLEPYEPGPYGNGTNNTSDESANPLLDADEIDTDAAADADDCRLCEVDDIPVDAADPPRIDADRDRDGDEPIGFDDLPNPDAVHDVGENETAREYYQRKSLAERYNERNGRPADRDRDGECPAGE